MPKTTSAPRDNRRAGTALIDDLKTTGRAALSGRCSQLYLWLKRRASHAPRRVCHLQELFIRHDGFVYPCCRVWKYDHLKIGHVHDPDIFKKISSFAKPCACDAYRLRKAKGGDKPDYSLLNLELSLACQGSCAMCCVGAPQWKGLYDYYDALTRMMKFCSPREILIQGGEILVQKKSLAWIGELRQRYPAVKFSLVSNGSVEPMMAATVKSLFDRVTISIVGFEPATYKAIMGLDFDRTLEFVKALTRMDIELFLKYLVTPLNAHEAELFLSWSIQQRPAKIVFADAATNKYIRRCTGDEFWNKIFRRAARGMQSALVSSSSTLRAHGLKIGFDTQTKRLFELNDGWIEKNGLQKVVFWNTQ